jgi:hypothetical protein
VVIAPRSPAARRSLRARYRSARLTATASGSIIRVLSPIVLTEGRASPLLPVDALEAVDRVLVEEGARVEHRDEGGVTARLGSRTTFRL